MDRLIRHALIVALVCLLPGCGGSSPTSPSPTPQPTHISGTITDTMSGASVGNFSADAMVFPAKVTVSSAGYVTRETWVRSASPTVDLIAEAGFDLSFYRQLARNTLEGSMQPLTVRADAPRIYLQTAGLSAANVAALEQAARVTVPALTGGRFDVVAWETGPDVRAPQTGWITAELVDEPTGAACGRGQVGSPTPRIFLNIAARCASRGNRVDPSVLAHEIGHTLGFWHVDMPGALMNSNGHVFGSVVITDLERRHAALAYHRQAGNLDVDSDPVAPAALRAITID